MTYSPRGLLIFKNLLEKDGKKNIKENIKIYYTEQPKVSIPYQV